MPIAKSIQDVILGEAAYTGVKDITYADMMGIASVINNRAIALGIDPSDVVSVKSEFNAYNSRLPAGVESYREMADQAWGDVLKNGSITNATFYSTPAATKNLPTGLEQQAAVPGGHVYFSDPYERAINTKVGYRQPQDLATVRAQVEQRQEMDFENDIPTPASRPEEGEEAVSDAGFDQSRFGERPAPESLAEGMQAQRDYAPQVTASPDVAAFDASRFGDLPGPASLAEGMAAQRDFVAPQAEFDAARMAASPALSEADQALASAMQQTAASNLAANLDPARMAPTVETSAVDPNVALSSNLMSPVALENVQAPAQDFAPSLSTALSPTANLNTQMSRFVPDDVQSVEGVASVEEAPATGINSPEHKALQAQVEQQLENPSISKPDPNAALSVPGISGPVDVASVTTDVTAPDPNAALSDPNAVANVAVDQAAISAPANQASASSLAEGLSAQRMTAPEVAADFAQEVGSQKKARISPEAQVRMETQMQAPALETVEIAEQPTIAAPVDDPNTALSAPVTETAITAPAIQTSATNPMQSAADRALGTAMGVWNGQVQTGIATDGSTVSRLDNGTVARYNPKFDQTEYTDDEGATWGGLVAGNQIKAALAADPNKALSTPTSSAANPVTRAISPGGILGGGILGKIVGLLSGLGSPTGVATAGTDGGMRAADHGAPGTPGGGLGGISGAVGGYGTTQGKDPAGTY